MGYVLVTETLKLVTSGFPLTFFSKSLQFLRFATFRILQSPFIGCWQSASRIEDHNITLILKSILGYGKTISYEELLGRDCEHENSRT